MAVSKFTSSSNVNDFNLSIGSTHSVVNLNQEYPIGAYSFTSSLNDISMDLYFYNGIGTLVGYTNTKGVIVSGGFNKIVVIGGTVGDVLGFTYKTTFNTIAETTEVTSGPVILSTSPTSLPNVNSSTTVTGLNFASDISATFTGTDNFVRAAKSVVRGSATSLVVTRPDTLPTAYSPYTLTVTNPSVAYQPTGSSSNIISVTAGVVPVWQTAAGALTSGPYGSAYSVTVSATDADGGSSITYSVVSGAVPTGTTFNTSTGVISGTITGAGSFTLRATDSGGNTADRAFTIAVSLPTVSGTLLQWYDFSDTTSLTTSSGNITAVTDKSGNSRSLSPSGTVPYLTSGINGLNTANFNNNGYLAIANPVTFSTKTAHMFAVASIPSGGPRTSNTVFIGATVSSGGMGYGAYSNATAQNFLNPGIAWGSNTGSNIPTNTPFQINGSINSGNYSLRKNRVDDGTGSLSGTISNPTNCIGQQEANNLSYAYVGEVIIYNGPLSTTDRNTIENYLNAKWGV